MFFRRFGFLTELFRRIVPFLFAQRKPRYRIVIEEKKNVGFSSPRSLRGQSILFEKRRPVFKLYTAAVQVAVATIRDIIAVFGDSRRVIKHETPFSRFSDHQRIRATYLLKIFRRAPVKKKTTRTVSREIISRLHAQGLTLRRRTYGDD